MPNKIHRRVYISKKHDEELDSLRLVRGRTDEVIVQEKDDDTFFGRPMRLRNVIELIATAGSLAYLTSSMYS